MARKHDPNSPFPWIGEPALRALLHANINSMAELATWREKDVLALHGVGPKAVGILKEALAQQGLAFKQ